jgi:hypothetical protein
VAAGVGLPACRAAAKPPGAKLMRAIKSQGEIEAAVCDAVSRFQQEFMGRGPRAIHAHLVENRLFVHLEGVLTAAEQRLIDGNGAGNGKGAETACKRGGHGGSSSRRPPVFHGSWRPSTTHVGSGAATVISR